MKKFEFKHIVKRLLIMVMSISFVGLISCGDDDQDISPIVGGMETGTMGSFIINSVGSSGVTGTVTFDELDDASVKITVSLTGTSSGNLHPAHIHDNSAAEGGGIAISLTPIDGGTGLSETIVTAKDDGTSISYSELTGYDGYVNVHLSADELGTIVGQGDIGQNILTGQSIVYDLGAMAVETISGTATFYERVNGESLAVIMLSNTPAGGIHPAHIHANSAAEGGGILFSFNPIDGTSGMSQTNVAKFDDGSAFGYADIEPIDGYINVHLSAEELGTLVAQGDIGQNILTGQSIVYDLGAMAVETISGTATFYERVNGEALAVIMLSNTPEGGVHPAHIHANSAAEGGGILFSFTPINGTTGMSKTNVGALNDGSSFTYADIEPVDGYINVHLSAEELGTLVAQGDIGQNILTGQSIVYELGAMAIETISGTATFYERVSGEALAVIMLSSTPEGGVHPAHIHANSAAEGGGILFSFNPINGTTGMSKTNVGALNDGSSFTYADIEAIDGYINVHLSAEELGTLVAQGDVGQNILTGSSVVYNLGAVAVETISGTATFHERVSGEALAVIMLSNTPEGGSHPAHIHANSAAVGGGILFSFNPINGTTGMSKTNVAALNDGSTFVYANIETVDGYINVHLSADELGTLVAQGNIGINEGTETENINFDITNSGSSSYIFNGGGFTNAEDPAITLKRGETYTLTLNAPGHPFLIKTDQSTGSGSTYNDGVTNNGAATGTITFTVPVSAPATLFYVCEFHGSMTGTITITD